MIDQTIAALCADWRARPFAWGRADCCQFAADAARRLHGIEIDQPAYENERQAFRALESLGGYPGLMALAGLQQRPIGEARRGDFVVFTNPVPSLFDRGLALVVGVRACAPAEVGLADVERSAWLECWGVA